MATFWMYRPASLSPIHSKNTNSATQKGEVAVAVVMVKAKGALTPRLAEGRMAAVVVVVRRRLMAAAVVGRPLMAVGEVKRPLMEVVEVKRPLMVVAKDIKAEGLHRITAAAVVASAGATVKVLGTKAEAAEEVAKVQ